MLYTHPVTPRAARPVTVFYNPDATVLRGRPEVWLRGSWNRRARPPPRSLPPPTCAPAPAAQISTRRVVNELSTCFQNGLLTNACRSCRIATVSGAGRLRCCCCTSNLPPAWASCRRCGQPAGERARMWRTWCRWSHPECYMPRRMTPADPSGNLGFLTAAVDVRRLPPPPPSMMCGTAQPPGPPLNRCRGICS